MFDFGCDFRKRVKHKISFDHPRVRDLQSLCTHRFIFGQ
jgi:hypothetical protein